MQNYVTSPEQTSQQHGSNASLNNILQHPPRSNTTRSMPNEFTIEQSGQPATKRRKSGTIFVNPPHQPDQAYIQQGQYQYQSPVQPFYFIPQQSQIQIPNLPQTIAPRNNNTSTRHGLGFAEAYNQRSKSNAISNNNIFNNSEKNQQAVLPTSQVISNQNNPHVSIPSQIVAPQIGFQNQVQMNNSQQQILQHGNNQGQVQQFPLDVLRPTSGQILYQVSQVPQVQQVQQVQQIQQSIHTSPIMDNQMYVNDTSSISTQETIQPLYQRLEILKSEIENKDFYQSRCEELNTYLNNENVYPHSQYNLYLCLKSVRNKAGYGFEIATKVFRNAMANINRFDLTYQGHIKKWFSELNKPSSSSSINGRSVSQRSSSLHGNPQLRQLHLLQQQQQQLQQQQQHQQHQQHQQQQINVSVNPPRIEQRPATDIEKANANWISRIIDRAWGHVMLPYESPIINHQAQQEFVNSFYVPHEKFERIWKPDTPFPPVHVHPNKLPITYRLISRKPSNLDDDNKCDWPPEEATFKIHINDSEIKLHRKQRIPIKQNQYSFVGVDKPVDIVQYLVAGVNRIKIIQCMCDPCRQQLNDHILSIEILVKETEDIVLRNARSQTLTKDHGTGIVKRLISGPSSSKQSTSPASSIGILGQNNGNTMIIDDDCDITVNKMKVSLRCPISLLRISEPAKGQNCRHIGCFDLQTYVNVNKKNCKWRCPECNDRVTSETLRTDEYFRELLEEIPKNVNIVELDSSGNWTIVGQDDGDGGETTDDEEVMQMDAGSKRSSLPSTSSKSDKVPAAIIILDDDDDEPAPNTSDSQQQAQSTQSTQSNNIPTTTTTTTTYSQSLWPTAVRQSSTPGVPYMVPVRTSNQTNQTNDQFIQSPPPSANISTTTIVQSPPDTTMYDPVRNNNSVIKNNNNKSKRNNNRRERKSRRGRVASQEKGNSSTKDNNNNDENNIDNDNSSGRLNNSNWSYVMGISSSQQDYNNILSSPQDIVSQTATQVASPISPVSVTNPNLHPMQDEIEEGEWLTEDEQEEVVLDSSKTILR